MEDDNHTGDPLNGQDLPKSDDSDSNRSTRSHVTISTSILKNKNHMLLLPGQTVSTTAKDNEEENPLALTIFPLSTSESNKVDEQEEESVKMKKEQSEASSSILKMIRITSFFEKSSKDPEPILVTSKRKNLKPEDSEGKHVHFKIPKGNNMGRFHLLHHRSKFLVRWHNIMLLPLSYEPWAYPFRLAFCNPGLGLHARIRILPFDLAFDGMFLMDTIIRLFTVVPSGTYPEQDFEIDRFEMILIHYMYHDFAIQWLPVIAFYVSYPLYVHVSCLD